MTRHHALSAALAVTVASIGFGATAAPAGASQCTGNLTAPHIVRMGTHATPTTGNGTVRVQVQVDADGSHSVTHIISSTNHGDDAAAREVAQSSTYRPATCAGRPYAEFYDPLFHFSGASVSSEETAGGAESGGGSAAARVEGLIRSGQYDTAKSIAQSALASDPNNATLLGLLGVAEYYSHDYDDAAASFARAGTPSHLYASVAAQAFANAAVRNATSNPQLSLDYAQRAVNIDHSANSRYALGVAQLADKQYTAAIETLQGVHGALFSDPHADEHERYALDEELLSAYAGAGQIDQAQATIQEMHRLEPINNAPDIVVGNVYIAQAQAAMTAKNYDQAIVWYDRAAALNASQVQLAGNIGAGFAVANMTPPNPTRLKAYADKALAIDPTDPRANFLEGVALVQQYDTSHSGSTKQQALVYLNKADAEAKAAGNTALATNIEHILSQLNGTAGGGMP